MPSPWESGSVSQRIAAYWHQRSHPVLGITCDFVPALSTDWKQSASTAGDKTHGTSRRRHQYETGQAKNCLVSYWWRLLEVPCVVLSWKWWTVFNLKVWDMFHRNFHRMNLHWPTRFWRWSVRWLKTAASPGPSISSWTFSSSISWTSMWMSCS